MQFEYVKHNVHGNDITFVLDKDNTDWYVETMRKRPFSNPVHNYLLSVQKSKSFKGTLKYADFGANIGVTSYFAVAHGIRTLSVEAGRSNFAILEEGKRANGFGSGFVLAFMAAAGCKGTLHFSENSAWGAISTAKEGTYEVKCDTIANILKQNRFTAAQVLKIDIEGAELSAMTGFEEIISKSAPPDIIMESNEPACQRNGYSCQDLWSRMIELGYDVYQFSGLSLVPLTVASAQDAQVVDFLATRRPAENLEGTLGYKIIPYSDETAKANLQDLLRKAPDKNGVKEFVARQMEHLKQA